MKKSKMLLILALTAVLLMAGCRAEKSDDYSETEDRQEVRYEQISQEEAKEIMDSGEEIVILDVREQDEYDKGHIPGAILLPYTRVEEQAEAMLPDKDKTILVYCRTGRRSKIAAQSLADLGYKDVREFGGILDWPYETTEENAQQ